MSPEGERWIWQRGRGLYDDLGNLTGIRAVLTDVTASRRAFEAARLATDETEGTRGEPVVLRLDTRGHIQMVAAVISCGRPSEGRRAGGTGPCPSRHPKGSPRCPSPAPYPTCEGRRRPFGEDPLAYSLR